MDSNRPLADDWFNLCEAIEFESDAAKLNAERAFQAGAHALFMRVALSRPAMVLGQLYKSMYTSSISEWRRQRDEGALNALGGAWPTVGQPQ